MERKAASAIMLTLLLVSMVTLVFKIQPVKAQGTIYIRADGSIDPPTAPISTFDNVTYTLTDNITGSGDGIIIERNNIIIDGDGYTLQGSDRGNGFYWISINNVTIKNTNIKSFDCGILLDSSSNNSVSGNKVTNNGNGIGLLYSSKNTISSNNVTNNNYGIFFYAWGCNNVSGNNIQNNYYGIRIGYSWYNKFYRNNFIDNTRQVYTTNSINAWDDGYPSGGNYWSDYTGVDLKSGPNQDQLGWDGVGDTPYIIDANNRDRYPLINPWIERKVGVKVGDWAVYGHFTGTYTPEWMKVTVQTILGTNITFLLVIHYKTSIEETINGWVDVSTSQAGGWWMPLFISANLSAGDTIFQTIFPAPINETILRKYVRVTRETNHFSFEWSFSYIAPGKYFNGSYSVCWDRVTGILTEFMVENVLVDETENRITSTSISCQIIDTNLWKNPLPQDLNDDGKVDIEDIVPAALAFGSYPVHPRWNAIADINQDNIVDIDDIILIAMNFGKTYP